MRKPTEKKIKKIENTLMVQNIRLQTELALLQRECEAEKWNREIFRNISKEDMKAIMLNWVQVHINDEDLNQDIINKTFKIPATEYLRIKAIRG